uniref:CUB domain-containing protein n=1 Tax=Meloidogyne enterolobii TaxID=390850 RepID=A0A6V7TUP5_MELEN|nr:unnamed protein product [Meloidogyne enterolobii]
MPYYNLLFIFLLPQLLVSITESLSAETTENIDSNNDCSCPTEEIFDSNWKEVVFKSPGFSVENCDNLDCKWNILPEENTFIYAKLESLKTEEKYDHLDVYQTSWNDSELIKVKRSSLSNEGYYIPLSSSINGGLYFHFVTNGINHNHTGFEVTFSRRSDDGFVKLLVLVGYPYGLFCGLFLRTQLHRNNRQVPNFLRLAMIGYH